MGIAGQESLKPFALGGDVVKHAIEHQVKVGPQPSHVIPGAVAGLDRKEILHRESVVR